MAIRELPARLMWSPCVQRCDEPPQKNGGNSIVTKKNNSASRCFEWRAWATLARVQRVPFCDERIPLPRLRVVSSSARVLPNNTGPMRRTKVILKELESSLSRLRTCAEARWMRRSTVLGTLGSPWARSPQAKLLEISGFEVRKRKPLSRRHDSGLVHPNELAR